jgi:hypothetical protein
LPLPADLLQAASCGMQIGDTVIYEGRRYLLRGFDPASVSPRRAYLEEVKTGKQIAVPLDELEPNESELLR